MPKLLIFRNIVFLIFAVDVIESRRHVHVAKKSVKRFNPAKFLLEPNIELSSKGDFTVKEASEVEKLIRRFEGLLNSQLDLFYEGKKVKSIQINR